jgi:hypothetical protein
MSQQLFPVWKEVKKYIDWGISVIPVRDKDDNYGFAKTPFGSWKISQRVRYTEAELFPLMDIKYNTEAVGLVGGEVSGNLEIIDIDVKYKAGIDAIIFTDLKTLYPEIYNRLRIHKSTNGGFHLLYRCKEKVDGNLKLAGRDATDEELKLRPKNKVYNFIETRGEGGYVVAPPALGYSVVKDLPIPVLTALERQSILSLLRSYNQLIKIEVALKTQKSQSDYYDINPFADYDYRINPTDLMQSLGWGTYRSNNHFIWFTRPEKKAGVSMSFNLQSRFFYCFTSSTELEENKGYSPSNLLAHLKFNGDKKQLYKYLVYRFLFPLGIRCQPTPARRLLHGMRSCL